jgi:hypothetical protein
MAPRAQPVLVAPQNGHWFAATNPQEFCDQSSVVVQA